MSDLDDRTTKSVEWLDFENAGARLRLVRDIVATANAGGGRLVVGIESGGEDHAIGREAISGLVDAYIAPDRVRLQVVERGSEDGRRVLRIDVGEEPTPPLVFVCDGVHADEGGHEVEVFAAGSVVVSQSRGDPALATREHHLAWMAAAAEKARAQLSEQLSIVLDAGAGGRLRIIDGDDVRDEPSYFLSRATDLFRARPERLLDSDDLRYLWRHRRSLSLDDTATELIIKSALRKRATLFLWLARLDVPQATVADYLTTTIDMKDRDKSDAGRSILQVACLLLTADDYRRLGGMLVNSAYAHLREAAEQWPAPSDASDALLAMADRSLAAIPDDKLLEVTDELVGPKPTGGLRQLPSIGLELLSRRIGRTAAPTAPVATAPSTGAPADPANGSELSDVTD